MHRINNRLLEGTGNFGDTIWATISKEFHITKLQREIAKALNFSLSEDEDETRRASELYAELSQRKKYVLILDDLWEAFSLERVGIPEPTSYNGCKLVLTTRSFDVCRRMACATVKVELLTEQEALKLFMSKAFDHETVVARGVKEIAIKITKKCACLPLAIVTVAGGLRGMNGIREWRNALNELINSTKEAKDDDNVVFEQLKFSYTRLRDKVLQHCFLHCAFYPEDHEIPVEELIEYWIAKGLIAEEDSIEAMFDKGYAILGKLTSACLLESSTDVEEVECVRLHDLLRDMALTITRSSPQFMVKAGEGLKKLEYEDWSEDLEGVSLMYNEIEELPITPPNCPRLTTLLLRCNFPPLRLIPNSFFMHMPRLEVLDLSFTHIQCLPDSISNLENLHALLLGYNRKLNSVPSLEKLKALKVLKLTESLIQEVPHGIEELVNLRKLDLSNNDRLETFPSWKLCRLSKLQFLSIYGTRVKVSAEELLCLRQLKVLAAYFHDAEELTRYAKSQQCQGLEKYFLSVGNCFIDNKFTEEEVIIHVECDLFGSGVDQLVLPSNIDVIDSFRIRDCHSVISLSAILSLRDAKDLRKCVVSGCSGIESIFSLDGQNPLRTVKSLYFVDLPNFRVLFDRIVPPDIVSFNLRELRLDGCPSMKSIFPAHLLRNFPNLEKLEVWRCENVEDIIIAEEEVEMSSDRGHHHHHQDSSNTITLPKLRRLHLYGLPRLKNIYKGMMVCESLQLIEVYRCPMVRRLPLSLHVDVDNHDHDQQPTPPPALKCIKGEREWWESLEWDEDPGTKTILQPSFRPVFISNGDPLD